MGLGQWELHLLGCGVDNRPPLGRCVQAQQEAGTSIVALRLAFLYGCVHVLLPRP